MALHLFWHLRSFGHDIFVFHWHWYQKGKEHKRQAANSKHITKKKLQPLHFKFNTHFLVPKMPKWKINLTTKSVSLFWSSVSPASYQLVYPAPLELQKVGLIGAKLAICSIPISQLRNSSICQNKNVHEIDKQENFFLVWLPKLLTPKQEFACRLTFSPSLHFGNKLPLNQRQRQH